MAGRQAKILSKAQINTALLSIEMTRNPFRDRVLFLLSLKAGLRACECANVRWGMIMDAEGNVSNVLALEDVAAKKNSGRTIPLNKHLHAALIDLATQIDPTPEDHIIRSERGGPMSANTVVHWFKRLYSKLGYVGCSSHSGRRTFITSGARKIGNINGSIRDIQELAGHRSLQMTASYIEGNAQAKRQLVNLI